MKHELLLDLADFLEKVPPREKFSLRRWGNDENEALEKNECQSAACAMGWASIMPKFRALGLRSANEVLQNTKDRAPMFNGVVGFEAIGAFFGIPEGQAMMLFEAMHYPEEQQEYLGNGLKCKDVSPVTCASAIRKAVCDNLKNTE